MYPRRDRGRGGPFRSRVAGSSSSAFSTTTSTVSGNAVVAHARPGTTSAPLIIFAGGLGSTETSALTSPFGPNANAAISAGWVVASSSYASPSHWGNQASQDALDDLISWVDGLYTITHIVIAAESMGGLLALNRIAAGSYDSRIRGVVLGSGVTDLAAIYASDIIFGGLIRLAYGIASDGSDYATKTDGYDPQLYAGSVYGPALRYRFYASPDDDTVDKATHSDGMDTLIGANTFESEVVTTSGEHSSGVAEWGTTTSDFMSFVSRCIIDWPSIAVAGTANKAAASSVALTIPSGTLEGDVMIAVLGSEGTSVTSITSSGWTVVDVNNLLGFYCFAILRRTATADDATNAGTGTYTFTSNGSPTAVSGACVSIDRADPTTPIGQIQGNLTSGTTNVVPSITVAGYNRLLVYAIWADAGVTFTYPAEWTEVAETAAGGTSVAAGMSVRLFPNPGAVGTVTGTLSSSAASAAWVIQVDPVD